MISRTSERFRAALASLPAAVRRQAREAYRTFRDNPAHPGLQFKKIQGTDVAYSVRITLDYRAVGVQDGDTIIWFWIGSHAEYDHLIRRMR